MCPTCKKWRDKDGAEAEGMANQWLPQNWDPSNGQELIPDTINDTMLYWQTIAEHNCPLRGSIWNRCRDPQLNAGQDTGESCGRVGEMIKGPKMNRDFTGRPTESTNLGLHLEIMGPSSHIWIGIHFNEQNSITLRHYICISNAESSHVWNIFRVTSCKVKRPMIWNIHREFEHCKGWRAEGLSICTSVKVASEVCARICEGCLLFRRSNLRWTSAFFWKK